MVENTLNNKKQSLLRKRILKESQHTHGWNYAVMKLLWIENKFFILENMHAVFCSTFPIYTKGLSFQFQDIHIFLRPFFCQLCANVRGWKLQGQSTQWQRNLELQTYTIEVILRMSYKLIYYKLQFIYVWTSRRSLNS